MQWTWDLFDPKLNWLVEEVYLISVANISRFRCLLIPLHSILFLASFPVPLKGQLVVSVLFMLPSPFIHSFFSLFLWERLFSRSLPSKTRWERRRRRREKEPKERGKGEGSLKSSSWILRTFWPADGSRERGVGERMCYLFPDLFCSRRENQTCKREGEERWNETGACVCQRIGKEKLYTNVREKNADDVTIHTSVYILVWKTSFSVLFVFLSSPSFFFFFLIWLQYWLIILLSCWEAKLIQCKKNRSAL